MSGRKITMKDVARIAGVSLGTVSNVINNKQGVKDTNREQVLEAMRQLQFVPNMAAKQLRSNQSSVIGLILPTIANPYYSSVAQSVSDAANLGLMSTLLCVTNRSIDEEIRIFNELISRRVVGIIAMKSALSAKQLQEYSKQVRIVLIDCLASLSDTDVNVDVVNTGNYDSMADAVGYVYSLGHRKIAYMAGDMLFQSAVQRLDGYKAGMRAFKLPIQKNFISIGNYSQESGRIRGLELLSIKDRPTAIICANEMMAVGLYQAAEEFGLHIPNDLSVVGCDNTMLAGIVSPRLTTIDQMYTKQGQMAVNLLYKRLHGDFSEKARTYILQTNLVINRSCSNLLSCEHIT